MTYLSEFTVPESSVATLRHLGTYLYGLKVISKDGITRRYFIDTCDEPPTITEGDWPD